MSMVLKNLVREPGRKGRRFPAGPPGAAVIPGISMPCHRRGCTARRPCYYLAEHMSLRYGRYEVLYKLGQGAMAQVFLAKDPVLSRFVAVKVLHADLASRKDVLQRFFNEARTVAVVRCPHVVEVFDFGQEGKDLYLVMEFVDGLSLHGLLRQLGRPRRPAASPEAWNAASARPESPMYEPLDPTVAAALVCQAAEGLTLAAQHGVVHRDIKPENLLLNSQGYLKISDFGIAHVQDDSLTKTGAVLGSPLYMSPEQARGLKPITSQADMFSLGAVFYACLVGHPPFRGRTVTELFRKIAHEAHAPVWRLRPDLDPSLGNLADTLLNKDPAARGGGPRWLHRQLKGYLMALGVSDPAELIAGYVRELSARGVQTTWKLDVRGGTLPATQAATERIQPAPTWPLDALPSGSLPVAARATRPSRESARRMPSASMAISLATLAIGVSAGTWGWLHYGRPQAAQAASAPETGTALAAFGALPKVPGPEAAPSGNRQDTGNAEASPAAETAASIAGRPQALPPPEETGAIPVEPVAVSLPPVTPAPGHGKPDGAVLILKSSPPFAEAFVDGRFVGVTPVRVDPLSVGRHRLLIRHKSVPTLDTLLTVAPGAHEMKLHLEAGAPIRVAASPEG